MKLRGEDRGTSSNLILCPLKCLSPQHTFPLYYSPKSSQMHRFVLEPLIEISLLLLRSKNGKSGHTLIHNRAMKGNGFDTG